ncbi:hypothetical protein [Aminivibrio sp.]|uniref:hypothetical protein n=1 Tax=Aminivibrio sp. TaxID=1872489 RepID=UPI001A50E202|nr:hypothetical protein [Aminivibrio sp.]MBL3539270.1 hypothetical protein [Aminivibrio sp.]
MLKKTKVEAPPGEFGEIEEEIRRFAGELEEKFEQKQKECHLAREQALIRLSEMEAETLRRVEAEWQTREKELELLASGLEAEIASVREDVSGRIAGDGALRVLQEKFFAALLGEIEL